MRFGETTSAVGAGAYPPAPWTLCGWGYASVQTVDARAAQRFVPAGCMLVSVAGRTMGGVIFASYESGSTLVYHELAIVAGLVRAGRRIGFVLARLYVDSAVSCAGGRAIWGVPKQIARFEIVRSAHECQIVVRGDDGAVHRVTASASRQSLRLPAILPAIGERADAVLSFRAALSARCSPTRVAIDITSSDLGTLGVDGARLGIAFSDAILRVHPPHSISAR